MSMKRNTVVAVAGMLAMLAVAQAMAAERFFRYENADGITVIDDHIPPQLAYKGYSVLDRNGRVVEVVPRALSEEERRDPNGPAVKLRLAAEEQKRQKRYDEALLIRYSTVADIEAAQLRKVNEIKIRINMLKGNVSNLQTQLETRQGQAAEFERDGQPVPAEYPRSIETLRAQIADAEAQIARHEVERTTTEMRYGMDIERFKVLRPQQAPPPPASTGT
jgi:hypothetical protein